uniref:Uncharacterized protein n=1 Tax=Ananas comosus var. bracteatus TaxID=296719 RepID=A0A6V7QZ11_ANACO
MLARSLSRGRLARQAVENLTEASTYPPDEGGGGGSGGGGGAGGGAAGAGALGRRHRLSLPFAACLAALACTHRLIRALLPSSSPYHYKSGRSIEHPRFGFDPYTSDEDDELLYSEEVIWDQIEALRTILGYSDTLHSSCAAELRALLVFTGVEPPISLNDPFDPIGVSDNLRFLKFLVGVK